MEERIFYMEYSIEDLIKVNKHQTKKLRKTSKFMVILLTIISCFSLLSIILKITPPEALFLLLFFLLTDLFACMSLYKSSSKFLRKFYQTNKETIPLSVKVVLDEKIIIENTLTYGTGRSDLNYSSVKEITKIDDLIYILFIDNRFVLIKTTNQDEVINYINEQKNKEF